MGEPPPYQGGRGRGYGRGGPGEGFRRGGLPLDPAMLERRRQSTAAIVQRQLQNVQVSESVAGQKAYTHYQRAFFNEGPEAVGPAPSRGLWDEDPVKRAPMYQALAAEETTFPAGRAQDPRDPFDIALEEYQEGVPLRSLQKM
ncbi:g1596 [Coccomyxa viridis]|uniref:G1596 protein n=1 Tax=Coccomyxa viridis TaxID=1274662 RepID=A0ABP1FQ61_9CHLO